MIESAVHFLNLCHSEASDDATRSMAETASLSIWIEVLDNYPTLWADVAQNRTIPPEVVERLAADGDERVRWLIAEKRKLPSTVFARLASDLDPGVRQRIAANQKTPITLLEKLVRDVNQDVSSVAKFNLRRRVGIGL